MDFRELINKIDSINSEAKKEPERLAFDDAIDHVKDIKFTPPLPSGIKFSSANNVKFKGQDINDPKVKLALFQDELKNSPARLLGEIGSRIKPTSDAQMDLSGHIAAMGDKLAQGNNQLGSLSEPEKKLAIEAIKAALRGMELERDPDQSEYKDDEDDRMESSLPWKKFETPVKEADNANLPKTGNYVLQTPGLVVTPAGDSIWDKENNVPEKINIDRIELGITNEGGDSFISSLEVFHDAGTWEMYTDSAIPDQIAKAAGLPAGSIDFSEQGMQDPEFMHFDIDDEATAMFVKNPKVKANTAEGTTNEGDNIYHSCVKSFKHEKFGEGTVLHGEHTLSESGEVSHYDAKFVREDGSQFIVRNIPVANMKECVVVEHGHPKKKKKVKEEETVDEADGGKKEQLQAWYDKYSKYEGTNDSNLVNGMIKAWTDSGILSDAYEDGEWADYLKKVGKESDELSDEEHDAFLSPENAPISYAMKADLTKIMGEWDGEETMNKVEKILGLDEGMNTEEADDMSTGTVAYGKKGKTRRATGINDNPYDHNEGEDHPALVNAALWNMKDIYQTIMAGEEVSEDDMFSYGDVLQYLDMSGIPGYDFYEDFIDTVSTAVSKAQPGGFAGQGDAVLVDKKFASKIKTLYQQFKAATAKIKGIKEGGKRTYIPDPDIPMPRLLKWEWQPNITRALRKAAGFPESAYVYFDDADLVYGDKTVWPQCGVDEKCTFGDAVKALKKFATAGVKEDDPKYDEDWFQGQTAVTLEGDSFYETFGWIGENDENIEEAEYQGRTVKLNKPMRGDVKKFKVYVKNPKGNVVKVNFGDPDMKIKKSNPARRRSFRARHNCDTPGPKHKARYWSCRKW